MYRRHKSRASKISMMVSIGLHIVLFIVFAFVKFLPDKEAEGATVAVEFVDLKSQKVLKRSLVVRDVSELSKSVDRQPVVQQIETRVSLKGSSDFYFDTTPERTFSEVVSLRSVAAKSTGGMRRPTIDLDRNLAGITNVEVTRPSSQSSQMSVSGGHELLDNIDSAGMAKPDIQMVANPENVMKDFLDSIRKKIESKKKYPPAARNVGVEGRSEVRMTILKDGQLANVVVINSSGHEILDKAALRSVRDAAPFPPIPKQIGRDSIEMSINLVFKIT